MDTEDFFITLMSNSSLSTQPNNKTSSFIVSLPQNISLPGKWRVAVAEIHYNYNFFNISKDNNNVNVSISRINPIFPDERDNIIIHSCEIPPGYYKKIDDVIEIINEKVKEKTKIVEDILSLDKLNGRCKVHFGSQEHRIHGVFLQGRLNMQLGFQPDTNLKYYTFSPHCCNINFGVPDQMLIYTDIIEPTFIGHEKAYVIKIVNTQPKQLVFGDACYVAFEQMHYMPVQKREFDTIAIDIRDHTGNFMPFQHGVFTVKLHFKKQNGEK